MYKKVFTIIITVVILILAGILIWSQLYRSMLSHETVKGDGYDFKAERISEKERKAVLDKEFPIPTDEVDLAFMQAVTDLKFPISSEIKSCYLEDPKEFYSKWAPEAHWDFESFLNSMYGIKISIPLDSADAFAEYMYQKINGSTLIERCIDANTWFGGEECFVPGTYIEYSFENNLSDNIGIGAYAIKTEQEYIVYFLI